MSWHELKQTLYVLLTFFGGVLLLVAYHLSHSPLFTEGVNGVLLFVTGSSLLLFGMVTYLLRDDWEIWQ